MNNHSLLRTVALAAATMAGTVFTANQLSAQTTTTYNFSILAGSGATLGTGATPSSNRFFNPLGMAVDGSGNIYVADAGDHTVKEISGGNVSVIAGESGQAGMTTFAGSATSSKFIYPTAVAVDSGGNVYFVDQGADAVYKVSGGNVSVVAGIPGTAGSLNASTGAGATFDGPQGIAVDGSGNVYVSDTNNSVIRKISATGVVSTLAGSAGVTGTTDGSSALFNFPGGIVFDPKSGNLYVADYDNSTIRSVNPSTGAVTTVAGTAGTTGSTNGAATAGALFNHPAAVAVDGNGNVYVMDTSNQVVREISAGAVTTVAGSLTGGHTAALFFYPQGIAVTSAGSIYVADTGNHEIKSITAGTPSVLAGAMGTIGLTSDTFNYPFGIAVASNGNVYVADSGNNAIRVISGGNISTLAGTGVAGNTDGPAASATFNNPSAVAVDSAGNVYVADTGNSTIRMISTTGTVSTISGTAGTTGSNNGAEASATYNHPQGIALDASGNIYIADTDNSVIREILKSSGQVSTYAGTVGQTGTTDNVRTQALFNGPTSVAVDAQGNVFVADFSNYTIRKISSAGNVTTLAGSPGVDGDVDGTGTHALFSQPSQIAVDANDNVYVADSYNHAIRVVSTGGVVTTIGGNDSRFYYPQGVAVASNGTLYVADGDNQSIDSGAPQSSGGGSGSGAVISNHTIPVGGSTTFTIGSAAGSATIQWQVSTDGGNTWSPAGSTSTTLTISNATSGMNGYEYRVLENGTTATSAATLYVGPARLINLSSRANVSGSNSVSAGFYVAGSGTKNLVIRGIGPGLAQFNIDNYLADPTLKVYNQTGPTLISSDTIGWGGGSTIANDMSAVGAFSLSPTSMDEVLVPALTISGTTGFSAVVASKTGGTGQVMAEIYDMDTSGTPPTRLTNISTEAYVDNGGANVLISGFVITGSVPETLLIRADGPSLSSFGVTGAMATPTVTLYSGQTQLQTNTGWGGNNAIATAAAQVGAFSIPATSADSALLVSLNPGSYSVEVTGANGSTGTTLLEIYEVQ